MDSQIPEDAVTQPGQPEGGVQGVEAENGQKITEVVAPAGHEAIAPGGRVMFTEVGSHIILGDPNDPVIAAKIRDAVDTLRGSM